MFSALKELTAFKDSKSIQKYLQFNGIELIMVMFLKGYENMKRGSINFAFDTKKKNSS